MDELNKNILNEINRHREIVGLGPIVEQRNNRDIFGNKIKKSKKSNSEYRTISPLSWNNGTEGKANMDSRVSSSDENNREVVAVNIGNSNLTLTYGTQIGSVQPVSKTETKIITMPSFTLKGGDLNYNDNCVLPNVNEGESKEKFDSIISSFVDYIKNGGFDMIQSIIIQGSADSGTPTLSGNDHVKAGYSKPFNGETDKFKMNQFLADERAKQYGQLVKNKVEEQTGKDISVKYKFKSGINYWKPDGNESKRGEQYRSIVFNVNAPELKVDDKIETNTTTTPVDETHKPVTINVYMPNGDLVQKQGVQIITQSGAATKNKNYGFYEGDEALSEIIKVPRTIVDGKIEGNFLILDGKQTCKLLPFSQWRNVISPEPPQASAIKYFCRVTSQYVTRQGVMMLMDYVFKLNAFDEFKTHPSAQFYGRN